MLDRVNDLRKRTSMHTPLLHTEEAPSQFSQLLSGVNVRLAEIRRGNSTIRGKTQEYESSISVLYENSKA
jgi:hypothetical protein